MAHSWAGGIGEGCTGDAPLELEPGWIDLRKENHTWGPANDLFRFVKPQEEQSPWRGWVDGRVGLSPHSKSYGEEQSFCTEPRHMYFHINLRNQACSLMQSVSLPGNPHSRLKQSRENAGSSGLSPPSQCAGRETLLSVVGVGNMIVEVSGEGPSVVPIGRRGQREES